MDPERTRQLAGSACNLVVLAISCWLVFAPTVLGFMHDHVAAASSIALGVAGLTACAMSDTRVCPGRRRNRPTIAIGAAAVIAPHVLSYADGPAGDPAIASVSAGIALATFALLAMSLRSDPRSGGDQSAGEPQSLHAQDRCSAQVDRSR